MVGFETSISEMYFSTTNPVNVFSGYFLLGDSLTNHIQKSKESIKLQLDVLIMKEEDYIVAYCPALELSSYGKNKSEAKAAFATEIKIFIEETSKSGNLEKYLLKHGWTLQQIPELAYQPPRFPLSITNKAQSVISHSIAFPIS